MTKDIQVEPFEIEVSYFTGRNVGNTKAFLNEKRLLIKSFDNRWDSTTNNWIEDQKIVVDKTLTPTKELITISKIPIDEYKAIPHEALDGGSVSIILKKNNISKQVSYSWGQQQDAYTIQFLRFINDNSH